MDYTKWITFQFLKFFIEINLFFVIFEQPLFALIYVVIVILLHCLIVWIKKIDTSDIDSSFFQNCIDAILNFIVLLQVCAFLTLFVFLKRKLYSIIIAIVVTLIHYQKQQNELC